MHSLKDSSELSGEFRMFTNLDKALVIQDSKVFNQSPLSNEKCNVVMTKLLYLINQSGEIFNSSDATSVFFSITKAFQSKDKELRRMLYLLIKELSTVSEDVIMVISSLSQDMNIFPEFKSNAIRTLGCVIDCSLISSIDRHMKQGFNDSNPEIVSSALSTAYHFFKLNSEPVKRWSPEIQSILLNSSRKNLSSLVQYHALGLMYLIKKTDRVAISKLISDLQSKNINPMTMCLNLQIYSGLLASMNSYTSILDMKPFLRLKGKNEMVALEACNIIKTHPNIYISDIVFAISTLQTLIVNSNPLVRFSAIRILNEFADVSKDQVSICNGDIESLITDKNRHIATLAITTLLKTGNEQSVDNLIKHVSKYISEISDEFKSIVVDAISSLAIKFPLKYKIIVQFLGNILRDEGGLECKKMAVDSLIGLVSSMPSSRDTVLNYLCELIEDCEYSSLTRQVIFYLGEEGHKIENPSKIVRYIYNRLVLEDASVRVVCLGSLTNIALNIHSLTPNIISLLSQSLLDIDDQVRDRAVMGIEILNSKDVSIISDKDGYDFELLESKLLQKYLLGDDKNDLFMPLDISTVPKISFSVSKELFDQKVPSSSVETTIAGEKCASDIITDRFPYLHAPKIHETDVIDLTEPDCEYCVTLKQYIYSNHLVCQFNCVNTMNNLTMSDINFEINIESDDKFTLVETTTIDVLKCEKQGEAYLVFQFETSLLPLAHCESTISFNVRDSNDDFNSHVSQELFNMNSFDLSIKTFTKQRFVLNSSEEISKHSELLKETIELQEISLLSEAKAAIYSLFGFTLNETDHGNDQTRIEFFMHGTLLMPQKKPAEHDFTIVSKLCKAPNNTVLVEFSLYSDSKEINTLLIESIC